MASRLDAIETGLTLILEGLDCSDGELGVVDGLARDAQGGPVLILLAMDGDALLAARALSAGQFLHRAGDGLVQAVPEAKFCPGIPSRVLVIGAESAAGAIAEVCELSIAGLHACVLAPFRVAGQERFAVRWLATPAEGRRWAGQDADPSDCLPDPPDSASISASPQASALAPAPLPGRCDTPRPEFVIPPARAELWQLLSGLIGRIDIGVSVQGDRFLRRITWNGSLLGDVRTVGDSLVMRAVTGFVSDLCSERDARRFVDQLLRAFVRQAGINLADLEAARENPTSENPSSENPIHHDGEVASASTDRASSLTTPRGGLGSQDAAGLGPQVREGQIGRGAVGPDRASPPDRADRPGPSASGRANFEANASSVASKAVAGTDRLPATRHAESRQTVEARHASEERQAPPGESLRSSLAAAKLTPEEYSALGDPSSGTDPNAEGSVARDRS